jgi:hypothetical protein
MIAISSVNQSLIIKNPAAVGYFFCILRGGSTSGRGIYYVVQRI